MTHDARSALLSAALSAAERGWAVFPLRPGSKRPALHGAASCPRTGPCAAGHRKWEQRATTDPERIRATWSSGSFNVGIATGPSGLLVVDLDVPKDNSNADAPSGAATFKALCERAGHAVPTTHRVRTASGGTHLYFTAPPGIRLANSAGKLGPLIDTRAWGGYVVAPGSTAPAGPYAVTDPTPPADLPKWLYALLAPSQTPQRPITLPASSRAAQYAIAALNSETATVRTAQQGQRDLTLLAAARALGRFVAWGDLPRSVVEEALQGAGEAAGLPPAQCRSTVRSGLNWSIAHNSRRRDTA